MIVAVDARHLAGGRGVAHHTAGLLGALAAAHPQDEWRAFVPGRAPVPVPPGVAAVRSAAPSRAVFGAAALIGRPRLDALAGGADVVWVPAPAPVAVSPGVPLVLTVHDLAWLTRPRDFTPYERAWHRVARLERLARLAAAVVCDTHTTRERLLATWAVPAARVHVVHPGVRALPAAAPGAVPAGPYLLAVGALEPRKGTRVLAAAFERARARGLRHRLVLAGAGRDAPTPQPGLEVRTAVGDAELAALYAGATALVVPSLDEGFGFPPLEAALAGTPSIVSDLPVFAETLGDAAVRVAPGDPEALAEALLRVAGDGALRGDLAARAAGRARSFTWERAAAEMHAILDAAAR